MNRNRLRVVANCVRHFGPWRGGWIGLQLLIRRGQFRLRIPSYKAPVFVRANTSDPIVFEKIFATKEYESDTDNPLVIVDLGANVGYASVYFAAKFPNSHVIAVEPDASNFELLKRNVRPYANVTTLQRAVWPRYEPIKIGNPEGDKWLFQIEPTDSGDEGTIRPITMPDLLHMCDNQPIDILKIDIESAEKALFSERTEQWLDKVRLLIIELHDNLEPGCSQTVYEAITNHTFNQWIRGENIFIEFKH